MQLILKDMINNTKRIAEIQLNKHRTEGINSKLSIFEVANLMDMMKRAESMIEENTQPNIFHSIAYN